MNRVKNMDKKSKSAPLAVFIGIVLGFSFLITIFLSTAKKEDDLIPLFTFYTILSSGIGILILSQQKSRQLPK